MKKKLLLISTFAFFIFCANAQTILGIDVSSYQGTINWTSVGGAGYKYAWAKATEGLTYTDAYFVTNETNGTAAGLKIGAYHFGRPETNSALSEANFFLSVAGPYINSCSLPPVLDLEDPPSGASLQSYFTSAQLTTWVQTFMTTVKNATGITPILYIGGSNASYVNSSLNTYPLWMADPDGNSSTPPATLGVWTTWYFKQYSWTTTVPGISGDVDMDVFNGNMAAFNILIPCDTTPCTHIYTPLPYSTSFENTWITDTCSGGAQRVPDKYWSSSVGGTTPNGNDYWHREDYTGVDWTSTTAGAYSPAASAGSHSARFHNDPSPAGSTGALDLHINLSTPGTKTISFDYIHNELSASPFSFYVELSTDGGATFPTTLLSIPAQVSSWTTETVTTTATSATSVIRFVATDKGVNDVGIDKLTVTVPPTASYTTNSSPVCAGSSISYTSTSTGSPTSYSWTFQNGTPATSTTASQVVTYNTAGTYTVSLKVTNSSGSSTATSSIVVNPLPVVSFSADSTSGCSPICVNFNNLSTPSSVTATWTFGDGNTSNTVTTASNCYQNPGIYSVQLTVTDNLGCSNTTTVNDMITAYPSPATPTITQTGGTLIANPPASNYQWYLNGVPISGATSQTYTAITDGNYTVEETNSFGCSATSVADTVFVGNGVNEINFSNSFNVYPNPTNGAFELNFTASNVDNYTIEIHNAIGQLVYQEYLSNYTGKYAKQINLQNFGKGIYMLSLTNSHHQIIKKLVVF